MCEEQATIFADSVEEQSYFDQLSDEAEEVETPKHKVMYTTAMRTGPKQYKEIDFDQVDSFDFDKTPFLEVVQKPEYVHFYIDSDNIETREEYDEFVEWLESLSEHFGKYAIGGYTVNNDLFGDLYKCQPKHKDPKENHTLSLHGAFYETKIKSKTLMKIMKHKQTRGKDGKMSAGSFVYKVNKSCDPNVYKLDSEQKMRHVLSNKFYRKDEPRNKLTKGSFLDKNTKPSQFMMAIRGDEEEIPFNVLDEIFNINEIDEEETPKKTTKKTTKRTIKTGVVENDDEDDEDDEEFLKKIRKHRTVESDDEDDEPTQKKPKRAYRKKQATITDIEFDDELIKLEKDELIELLNNFDIHIPTLLETIVPLYHSPYPKEFLKEVVDEWYQQAEHTHPELAEDFVDRYYEQENTNKWFFSLINKLDDEKRDEYRAKYCHKSIDFSIDINNSNVTYQDVKKRTYTLPGIVDLFNDLRGCVGVIDDVWYLKTTTKDETFKLVETEKDKNTFFESNEKRMKAAKQNIILFMSEDKLMKKLKTFKPFKGNHSINLYQIVAKFSNFFMYEDAKITNDNYEGVINLFQGFKYDEIATDDFTIIQPFLDHIKHIICNDNEAKYDYYLKWFANMFQNITVKNGTMPIVWGAQGTGKSFAVETFCDLLGYYGLANVDDLDKVFGKFNGLIGQHLLININEPPNADEKFEFTGKIKSKLTQKKHIQETKGIDSIEIVSYANFCVTTNNPSPVQEEKGDRRIIYFEVNNEKAGDEEYFNELCKPIQPIKQGPYNPNFMGVLLYYMRHEIDVTDFNPERLVRAINADVNAAYNEQLERQYESLDVVERFVVDNYKEFVEGVNSETLNCYCSRGKFPGYKLLGVQKKLNAICEVERTRIEGKQARVYKLKDQKQISDLYNIILYQHHDDEEEEKKEEEKKE